MRRPLSVAALLFASSLLRTQIAAAQTAPSNDRQADETGGRHELYGTSGFSLYSSDHRVLAGFGAGPGYRLWILERLNVHVEARWLLYFGSSYAVNAGASYAFRFGWWEPAVGAQALLVTGDSIRVLSSAQPEVPSRHAWAPQLRIEPLRQSHKPFTVSLFAIDIGLGSDAGSRALAFSLSLVDMGVRF